VAAFSGVGPSPGAATPGRELAIEPSSDYPFLWPFGPCVGFLFLTHFGSNQDRKKQAQNNERTGLLCVKHVVE